MASPGWDCCGWATKNDLLCSDGRIIKRGAFAEQDGATVPVVWQHQHDSVSNVLGHAELENRDDGVFSYLYFNDTDRGRDAKEAVQHGDINALSIYANKLKQVGPNVVHGAIRELSLVLTGANPGASIQYVNLSHSDDGEFEGVIFTGEEISEVANNLHHADDAIKKGVNNEEPDTKDNGETDTKDNGETVQDVFNTLTEKQKKVVYYLIGQAVEDAKKEGSMQHSDDVEETEPNNGKSSNESEETIKDVFDTLTEKQKKVVYFLIGMAVKNKNGEYDDEMAHSYTKEGFMKNNIFDNSMENREDVLTHSQEMTIIGDMKKYGSLKDSVLSHAEEYGIEQIDYLFPEYKNLSDTPEFIRRENSWVDVVLKGVHRTPFSRIKTMFADITADAARAKGYFKGNLKKDEVFTLLKRTTAPTTIYKKQRFDRDDITDLDSMNKVAWVKTEMREQLDEELARAILFSDGRSTADDDKISETNIRPIYNDAELYTVSAIVVAGDTDEKTTKNAMRAMVKAKTSYRGSGNLTLFARDSLVTDMLLLEDTIGHPLYKTETELAAALRVNKIVSVPAEIVPDNVYAVAVDLKDYNVGADAGGAVNMFEDFDIDYNQMKYLIETRASGALIKPYSAIVLKRAE